MVCRTNERLTCGNEIPKKSCRPLQGSAGAAGERSAFFCCRRSVSAGVRVFQREQREKERGKPFRCFSAGEKEIFRGFLSIVRRRSFLRA